MASFFLQCNYPIWVIKHTLQQVSTIPGAQYYKLQCQKDGPTSQLYRLLLPITP